jgi:tRNA-modifying protein YgfZ
MTPRFCPLPDVGCIEVSGADARAFLHAQLTRDIAELGDDLAPLAAWCDPRGRVRALFRVLDAGDRWLLIAPRDIIDSATKRLRMFVLRSKVTLATSADAATAVAIVGEAGETLAARGLLPAPRRDAVIRRDDLHAIRIGPELVQLVGPRALIEALDLGFEHGSPALAELAEVRLGLPAVTAALAERFVPQMLNLDLLDAISFDKGCYQGQEVIARVHHLGSVKRRMRRYAVGATSAVPLTEIVDSQGRAIGEIVRIAPAADGCELLAVVEQPITGADPTIVGNAGPLIAQALPYDVPSR